MFKKTLLAALLIGMSTAASADLITPTQTETFTGVAGNDSTKEGVNPFTFDKFDESLGTLTGVYVEYSLDIANGLIGADNLTNEEVQGTGDLGGDVILSSNIAMFRDGTFTSIFDKLELLQTTTFTLAADPTLSVGGTEGEDIQSFYGSDFSATSGLISLNSDFLSQFVGTGETFDVDFDSGSTTIVDVSGAQGFFQAVDMIVSMDVYYTYEELEEPASATEVPVPFAFGALGLAFAGLGFKRRKD
jgi:hypothetical protein